MTPRIRVWFPLILCCVEAGASVGCREAATGPTLSRVAVHGRALLAVGDTTSFGAVLLDQSNDTLPSAPVSWTSSAPDVATVNHSGLVTALAPGQATIRATVAGIEGSGALTVHLAPVVRVLVVPVVDSLLVGTTRQLYATLLDSAGRLVGDRVVTWASSDTSTGAVSSNGLVSARKPGSFAVTAVSEGVTGGAFLNAQQAVVALLLPDSFRVGRWHQVRFLADLRSATGTHLSGRPVQWSSSDTTIATMDSTGLLSPRRYGSTLVRAASPGVSDTCRVMVVTEPVASVWFDRALSSLAVGQRDTVVVRVWDAGSQDVPGIPVTWASSDSSILQVEALGTNGLRAAVLSLRAGTAAVTASAEGKTASNTIVSYLPANRFRFQEESLTVRVGEGQPVYGAVWDTLGTYRGSIGVGIHVSSSDTSVMGVDSPPAGPVIVGRKAGRARLFGRLSNGWADTATVVVTPAGSAVLTWTPPGSLLNYDSAQVQLSLSQPPARVVSLRSSDTTVITASPSSVTLDGTTVITVRTHRSGGAVLQAATDSTFAGLFLSVLAVAPQIVRVAPRPTIIRVGDTVNLAAAVTGMDGVLRSYPVSWTSSDTTRAAVSASGLLTGRAAGAVMIRSTSGGAGDSLPLQVVSPAAIRIDSVSPARLSGGGTATIFGAGLDAGTGTASVSVGGVPALVTSARSTAITLALPPAAAFPCTPERRVLVVVTAGALTAADSAQLDVANHVMLPLDSSVQLGDGPNACVALPAVTGGAATQRYRMMVTNVDGGAAATFTLAGMTTPSPAAPVARGPAPPPPVPGGAGPLLDSLSRAATLHRRILEGSRTHASRAGPPVPLLLAARRAAGPLRSPGATINGVALIRVPRVDRPDLCASYTSVQARLVYSGPHSRIFEDLNAPLAGTMDSAYGAIGAEFDSADYPELLADFGDPLLLDSLLDGAGRVTILFTPVVNAYGAGGFVTDCDFYPESVAPSSNTTEILYAQVPTDFGSGFGGYTVDEWRRVMRTVMMHESKHITSLAAHLAQGAPLEETWLEEASAVAAEEVWSRASYGSTWKGHAFYSISLYCDVRPTFPQCAGRPYSMFNAFAFFYDYAQRHEARTPLGPTSSDDASFYGSGWALLRWAVDQYAGTEGAFLRALTQEPGLTGMANLAARTGHPAEEMLSDWFAAWTLQTLDTAVAPVPPHTFPSWDLSDIFSGMNRDFPQEFPVPFPGSPWQLETCCGPIAHTVRALPPGGSAHFDLKVDAPTPSVLHLSSPDGTPAPHGLRVQFARIR